MSCSWAFDGGRRPRCAKLGRVPRRLALLFALLLVLSAVLTAIAPRDEPDDAGDRSPDTATASATGADVTAAVRGVLPRDRVVRARVGDDVELTVTARGPDSVTIGGLGLTDAAIPGAPAQFSFRADRAGTFAVALTISGGRAGRIVVRDAGP